MVSSINDEIVVRLFAFVIDVSTSTGGLQGHGVQVMRQTAGGTDVQRVICVPYYNSLAAQATDRSHRPVTWPIIGITSNEKRSDLSQCHYHGYRLGSCSSKGFGNGSRSFDVVTTTAALC